MEEGSFKATAFAQRVLTKVRAIGMTSIDSMVYSFIALPQSETIINLKSVNIDMRCNIFCSSNVQVIIFLALNAWSFLYLCPPYFKWVEILMENNQKRKFWGFFETHTVRWSLPFSLHQIISSGFSAFVFLLRMKILTNSFSLTWLQLYQSWHPKFHTT